MKENLIDKARGCLTGLAVGDALGVHTEGKTREQIKEQYGFVDDFISENPAGSDDTEFALFNAITLLKNKGKINACIIADEWKKFIAVHKGQYKGAGFSEMMAIENLKKGLTPPYSGMHAHSWSDGLAMRIAPFGIVNPGCPEKACALVREDGSVTHSGEGIYSAEAVVSAIAVAMTDASIDEIYSAALNSIPEDSWSYRAITKAVEIGRNSSLLDEALSELYTKIPCGYYHWADLAPEAVGLSFGMIAAANGDFEKAVLGGVNIGRDTDTIAAISGAILGAKIGYRNIPEKWSCKIKKVTGSCVGVVENIELNTIADELVKLID